MYKFSNKSLSKLNTCDIRLQKLFNQVIKYYDCSILEGYRSDARQEELYNHGKSKLRAGQSKHNQQPSLAVDVVPYPLDWQDLKRFYHFMGFVKATAIAMGIEIRCGGDWDGDNDLNDSSFVDLPHFELKI